MANFFNRHKKSKNKDTTKSAGSVRQNQLITSYGVGSIIDFVSDTVMIAGIDDWDSSPEYRIHNENLQSLTGVKYFVRPKTDPQNDRPYFKSNDIPSYVFPEKIWCTECKHIIDIKSLQNQKDSTKCIHCGKKTLVSSRFVIACENGHIEDFPYHWWVHRGQKCISESDVHKMTMFNIDNRSGIDSLMLKCEHCGKIRPIAGAFAEYSFSGENGYKCNSNFPHLKNPKNFSSKECTKPLKAVLRTSSSVYFPVSVSALSIPPWSKEAVKIVSKEYEEIQDVIDLMDTDKVKYYLQKKFSKLIRPGITEYDLFKAYDIIKSKKDIENRTEKDIYEDEYKELCKGDYDDDKGDFAIFTAKMSNTFKDIFDKVVIVERLTEVQALSGFTRIKPSSGALDNESIAPLSMQKLEWLPAVELRGEGIFIKFNEEAVNKWETITESRYQLMFNNFNKSYFNNNRYTDRKDKCSNRYILLHSFAHLLMRQISMDCGYNVASLKEKIYSTFVDDNSTEMSGILIYLTSSDADGSLGGLTGTGSNKILFEKIIINALQKAMWCSADPLCISSLQQGFSSLNYSACHDCLLVPETSCEFRNVLLDRASLIGTENNDDVGFFSKIIK